VSKFILRSQNFTTTNFRQLKLCRWRTLDRRHDWRSRVADSWGVRQVPVPCVVWRGSACAPRSTVKDTQNSVFGVIS